MSDASKVKRWETPHMMRYRLPSERKSDTDHVTESYAYPCVVVLASDHDRIMAERDELWKRATKFVIPGETDTGESVEHYIKTLEQTVARQAKVIEKLREQRNECLLELDASIDMCQHEEWAKKYDAKLAAIEQGRQAMNPDNPNFRTPEEEARAAELVRLKAEVARQARVIEKLKRYTQHRVDCICRAGVFQYSNDCDCGLKAIEKEGAKDE